MADILARIVASKSKEVAAARAAKPLAARRRRAISWARCGGGTPRASPP
jgi:hypothetical protein